MSTATGPRRFQRSRRRGARMPQGVYVGRPSAWGNPWQVGENGVTPLEAVRRFREFLSDSQDPRAVWMRNNIHVLAGRSLICWCHLGGLCHADVLLEKANGLPVGSRPCGKCGRMVAPIIDEQALEIRFECECRHVWRTAKRMTT